MILGVMQPYFFPYLGYFDLINYTNRWIVLDTVQYIYQGWMNRNRIMHANEGWQYITVPLNKHSYRTAIKDIRIVSGDDWRQRIIGRLQHYKNRSTYYDVVVELIREGLNSEQESLSRLNVNCLKVVCNYLGIQFDYEYLSEMALDLGDVNAPGEWSFRIAEALGAEEYANLPGGALLFSQSLFKSTGIKLTLRNLPPLEYQCRGYGYIPNLSIIDLLMWNSPDEIKKYLDGNK